MSAAQADLGVKLPEPGLYGVGNIFLADRSPGSGHIAKKCSTASSPNRDKDCWAGVLCRRELTQPTSGLRPGPQSRRWNRSIIAAAEGIDAESFDRQLYVIRKMASRLLRMSDLPQALMFYICSLSSRVIVYKGMLTSHQLMPYYPDLQDPDYRSHLAMVHSRFSTNTFPSWDRAHPNRYMAHNGEINTLRGNMNWMFARQGSDEKPPPRGRSREAVPHHRAALFRFGKFRQCARAVAPRRPQPAGSRDDDDSGGLATASDDVRGQTGFYEYHSALQEPWDGPASISFTDGNYIGAVLDRNGLGPAAITSPKTTRW